MARLAQFTINTKAVEEGEWIRPDEDLFDDLEVYVRGITTAYTEARDRKMNRAATARGVKTHKLPSTVRDEILVDCINEHLLLDVRNLTGRNGEPVTIEQFKDLLHDSAYARLVLAVITAAAQVGRVRDDAAEDATKN